MPDPKRIGLSGQARGIDPQRQRRNSLTTDETVAAPITLNERGQITLGLAGAFTVDSNGNLVLNVAPPLTVTNNSPLTLTLQTDTTLKTANGKLATNIPVATASRAGLMPALEGSSAKFLAGDGAYRIPIYPVPRLDECAPPTDTTNLDSSTTAHGLLPKLSGVVTEALLGDGTWGTISTDLGYVAATRDLTSSTGTSVNLPLFTDTEDGLTPASGGGTTNFLRADGTWAAPSGGGSGLDQPAVMARMAFGGF
jgi:hypothetical protein